MAKQNRAMDKKLAACIVMLTALLWLTISLPFLNAGRQAMQQFIEQAEGGITGDDTGNPIGNPTEENTESGTTLSEYLYEVQLNNHLQVQVLRRYKAYPLTIYFSHHPEAFSPPPEA